MGRRSLKTRAFDFLDYRAYLRAVYHEYKGREQGFTYREFSTLCGFSSSGAVKLVIDNKRRLSLSAAQRITKMLRLPGEESEFFINLVRFNDARDDEERNIAFTKLKATMAFRQIQPQAITQFEYYRKWYYVAIREMVALDDFEEKPSWVAKRLTPSITPAQARGAIKKLEKMGFLRRDSEGNLRQNEPIISTEPEIQSLAVKNFHREMMQRAAESMENQSAEERDIRCVTVAISEAQAERIKQMNTQYMKDILDVVAEDDKIEAVYQLNLHWFRLTRKAGDNADDTVDTEE